LKDLDPARSYFFEKILVASAVKSGAGRIGTHLDAPPEKMVHW
jgi:hypothetical protein